MYDDFDELRPGAVQELQARLRELNKSEAVAYIDLTDSDQSPSNGSVRNHTFAHLWHSLAGITGMLHPMTLPRHRKDVQPEMELGLCPNHIGEAESDHSFVLFRVPFRRWATNCTRQRSAASTRTRSSCRFCGTATLLSEVPVRGHACARCIRSALSR